MNTFSSCYPTAEQSSGPCRNPNSTEAAFRRLLKTFLLHGTSAPSELGGLLVDGLYQSTHWHWHLGKGHKSANTSLIYAPGVNNVESLPRYLQFTACVKVCCSAPVYQRRPASLLWNAFADTTNCGVWQICFASSRATSRYRSVMPTAISLRFFSVDFRRQRILHAVTMVARSSRHRFYGLRQKCELVL